MEKTQNDTAPPRRIILAKFPPFEDEEIKPAMCRALSRLEQARIDFSLQCESRSYTSSTLSKSFWMGQSRELLHPLSDTWLSVQPNAKLGGVRSLADEAEISRVASLLLNEEVFADAVKFEAWICEINAAALGGSTSVLRDMNVVSSADLNGWRRSYCPPSLIRSRIGELSQILSKTAEAPASVAVIALAGVLIIHPFEDGNGRTARAVFNAIIGKDAKVDAFLPLRLIFDCSSGGFEIRLRELEVNGNWLPLIKFFTSVFLAR